VNPTLNRNFILLMKVRSTDHNLENEKINKVSSQLSSQVIDTVNPHSPSYVAVKPVLSGTFSVDL
jgi:hypothetical protein